MRAVLKEIFQERKEVGKEKEEVESLKFAILFTINTLSWNIYISSVGVRLECEYVAFVLILGKSYWM